MDYNKSLLRVWMDTMQFMNLRGLIPVSDVIEFGGLVKFLLVGDNLGPLKQALQPHKPQQHSIITMQDDNDPRAFVLRENVVGCIVAVGPSPADLISSRQDADTWAALKSCKFSETNSVRPIVRMIY